MSSLKRSLRDREDSNTTENVAKRQETAITATTKELGIEEATTEDAAIEGATTTINEAATKKTTVDEATTKETAFKGDSSDSAPKAKLRTHCKYFSTGGSCCMEEGQICFVHDREVRGQAFRDKKADNSKTTLAQSLGLNDKARDDKEITFEEAGDKL